MASLPRPVSRFRRPQSSWSRRLLSSGGLRLTFLFSWLFLMMVAWSMASYPLRAAGYLYSTEERITLWKRLPEPRSTYLLTLIYDQEPGRPEVVIANRALHPGQVDPAFLALARDPRWAADCARATQVQVPVEPFSLDRLSWTQETFEQYAVRAELKGLTAAQRGRLDDFRHNQLKATLKAMPRDDHEARLLCRRMRALLDRPSPLHTKNLPFIREMASRQLGDDLHGVAASTDPAHQLALLRRVAVSAVLSPPLGCEWLAGPIIQKAREKIVNGQEVEHNLRILAHMQKLQPDSKVKNLELKLTPAQRQILETDPWLY
ncbi:MAG: hypothetical protein U0931_28360 [Vulcanimicrobiota bacterium]